MERKDICVYLAGPMTGCNIRQATEWRKSIGRKLKNLRYTVSDPTATTARKGVYSVTADVDDSDVVIACLWKESIGTVLGIVQARRADTPVIVINQNYIEIPVLIELGVQEVLSEDGAINALEDLFGKLSRSIFVIKKVGGKPVPFDRKKLKRSFQAALNAAKCDDSVLLSKLLRDAHQRISRESKKNNDTLSTSQIRVLVFETLGKFQSDGNLEIAEVARLLADKWGNYEIKKPNAKGDAAALDQLIADLNQLKSENDALRLAKEDAEFEVQNLRAILSSVGDHAESTLLSDISAHEETLEIGNPDSLVSFFHATALSREKILLRTSAKRSFRNLPHSDDLRLVAALRLLRDQFLTSKIAETAAERFAAWESFKCGLRDERFENGPTTTKTGLGQSREEHTIKTDDGRELLCHKIRDIGRTYNRQDFVCIYFAWDEVQKKLHIKGFDHGQTQNSHT